jgi:hypothetical protein
VPGFRVNSLPVRGFWCRLEVMADGWIDVHAHFSPPSTAEHRRGAELAVAGDA